MASFLQTLRCTFLWAIPVVLLLAGCGDSSIQLGSVTLIRHSNSITATTSNQGIVTVSCAPGESLVSGGFSQFFSDSPNTLGVTGFDGAIAGSFPSDSTGKPSVTPTSWTVQSSDLTNDGYLTTYINCVKTSTLPQVTAIASEQVYTASGSFSQQASCPTGTIRTGGGFNTSGTDFRTLLLSPPASGDVIFETFPIGTQDWTITGSAEGKVNGLVYPMTVDVYAICVATTVFAAAPLQSTTYTFPMQQVATTTVCPTATVHPSPCRNDLGSSGEINCPAGQLTTGGGFSALLIASTPNFRVPGTNFASIYTDTAVAGESSWLIQFRSSAYLIAGQPFNPGTATLWAVCITPHA